MEEILNTKFTLRFPSRNILIYNLCYGRNMSKLVPGLVYDFLHFISVWFSFITSVAFHCEN
jgi:hypothetical protein